MAEVRVSHVLVVLVLVGAVAVTVIFFGGAVVYYFYEGRAITRGYSAAKTPTEAMDNFHKAIQNRHYDDAARYTTKAYAEQLKRSHVNASELGATIDKIRDWAAEKGLLTDKLKIALFSIDPFPKNFKVGAAPKQEGDNKTYGFFKWEPYTLKTPGTTILEDVKAMDPRMFRNVLAAQAFTGKIELVKEGEEWKLNIPTTPAWEVEISYFNDRCKTYQTGLNGMWSDLNNQRYDTGPKLEGDVFEKLRAAK